MTEREKARQAEEKLAGDYLDAYSQVWRPYVLRAEALQAAYKEAKEKP